MRLSLEEFAARFPDHPISRETAGTDKTGTPKNAPPRKKAASRKHSGPSVLEERFAQEIRAMKLPAPEREFAFHDTRRWRFDFAWPQFRLAVEIEGGVWNQGRHTRPHGFIADTEKYNTAHLLGWTVLRFTGPDIRSGRAIDLTQSMLARAADVERPATRRPMPAGK